MMFEGNELEGKKAIKSKIKLMLIIFLCILIMCNSKISAPKLFSVLNSLDRTDFRYLLL